MYCDYAVQRVFPVLDVFTFLGKANHTSLIDVLTIQKEELNWNWNELFVLVKLCFHLLLPVTTFSVCIVSYRSLFSPLLFMAKACQKQNKAIWNRF